VSVTIGEKRCLSPNFETEAFMKVKFSIIAFLMICALALSNGYLYAQDAGDVDDTRRETGGVALVPSDNELASLLTTVSHPDAVVRPLIQTKWTQRGIFSSLYPPVNGQSSICGCVNLAWAQLMKFHQHPVRGRGQSTKIITVLQENTLNVTIPSVNLNVAYDWNNMLTSYRSDGRDSNDRQRNAVATLVHHIGAARGTNTNIVEVMTTVFGYDRSIRSLDRTFFTDAEWEAIIRQQLDAGLPVFYWGNDSNTSHGFIIDGYDNTGRFHINLGWGGLYDGWYSLNNINPRGRSEFYNNQYIVINFKPEAGGTPAPYELGFRTFTADKTTVSQYELFNVNYYLRNIGSVAFDGELSAVLVDNADNIVAVIGTRASTSVAAGSGRISYVTCSIPSTVRPGQYRLQIVTRPPNGERRTVTRSAIGDGVPNAINITVSAGEANGGGYGMGLTSFTTSKTTVSRNEQFDIAYRFLNVGAEAFNGQTGAALVDNNNNIVAVLRSWNTGNFVVGARNSNPVNITCTVPNTAAPGRYRLRMVVRPTGGEWRIATISVEGNLTSIDFTVR
jgi:hypothetical protein